MKELHNARAIEICSEITPGNDLGSNLYSQCFPPAEEHKVTLSPVARGERPAPPPCEADLNVKTGTEGAGRSRGCNLAFPRSCRRSVLGKVAPCKRLFPSPGCRRGRESRAGRLLPSASPNSLFTTKDEPSRERCAQPLQRRELSAAQRFMIFVKWD